MGRTIAIILGLIVVAGGGYYLWQSGALDNAAESVDAATEDAAESAADAVDATTSAAEDAAEAATDTVGDAAESATDAVTDAVEGAADAATEAVEGAGDALGGLLDQVPGAGQLTELLTPEGFDADGILAALDGVELPEGVRDTVTAAVESARDNPEMVEQAIATVREALGL